MATTSRTAPTSARAKKPTVHFDIAKAVKEREAGEGRPEPYGVNLLDGKRVEFRDPEEYGWQEASSVDPRNPYLALQVALLPDDYKAFIEQGDFPQPVLAELIDGYREHYGLPELGN